MADLITGSSGLAVMEGNAGRWIVGVARRGRLDTVVKIGAPEDAGMINEAAWLRSDLPVAKPELVAAVAGEDLTVIATGAVPGFACSRVPDMEEVVQVCVALQSAPQPVVHGDLTPWNLAVPISTPVVIDWEHARHERSPLTDLTQFVVKQASQVTGRAPSAVLALLVDEGGPGWVCLEQLGLVPSEARAHLRDALRADWRRHTTHAVTAAMYEYLASESG